MQTKILQANDPTAIPHAVDVLHHGGLVAFPTDTVYGLGAWPFDPKMLERLFVVKGRNHTKAIAVLLGQASDLDRVSLSPNETARRLAKALWPGPVTLIVPRHPGLPESIAPSATIGVRIPDHPIALKLLQMTGPLAVTSANLSGKSNALTARQVNTQLKNRIHLILDGGRTPGGVPSTVVDCTTSQPKILRPGPITLAKLEAVLSEQTTSLS
jgi:L-threonylcarbamoyladenylate synthase